MLSLIVTMTMGSTLYDGLLLNGLIRQGLIFVCYTANAVKTA